jgi:hypothetical protein
MHQKWETTFKDWKESSSFAGTKNMNREEFLKIHRDPHLIDSGRMR